MKKHYRVQSKDVYISHSERKNPFRSYIACGIEINKKHTTRKLKNVTCKRCLRFISHIPTVFLADIYNPEIFSGLMKNTHNEMAEFLKGAK